MADATKIHAFLTKTTGSAASTTFEDGPGGGFKCTVRIPAVAVNADGFPETSFSSEARSKKAAKAAAMKQMVDFVTANPVFTAFVQADDPQVS